MTEAAVRAGSLRHSRVDGEYVSGEASNLSDVYNLDALHTRDGRQGQFH